MFPLRTSLLLVYGTALLVALLMTALGGRACGADAAERRAAERLFEQRVRPLLARHCWSCHGPRKQQAGLRLDSRQALLQGNDSGPAVVPRRPESSRLMAVLRYADDDVQMPPAGRLPQTDIDAVAAWIRAGAPWPDETVAPRPGDVPGFESARRQHWAYRPIRRPPLPPIENRQWVWNAIDRFIVSRYEQVARSRLAPGQAVPPPAPVADRRTLLRRLHFDLVGLPPTYEDLERFAADPRPDAYARRVDRLLASPAYGERWGRHWLDIARYADNKGYVLNTESRYPYAYTYRDYVVQAFNEDLPYDRFILEQIAADLVAPNDPSRWAALGFLTVGRRFLGDIHGIIDDRIDVVTRGLMGLTVSCARCHDHKYDPVPSADYYALYGVFASCYEPDPPPLLGPPADTPRYRAFRAELDKRQQALDAYLRELRTKFERNVRDHVRDYLIAAARTAGRWPNGLDVRYEGEEPRRALVSRWQRFLLQKARERDRLWNLWVQVVQWPAAEFQRRWQELMASEAAAVLHPALREELSKSPPRSVLDVAAAYARLCRNAEKRHATAASRPAQADQAALWELFHHDDSPLVVDIATAQAAVNRAERNRLKRLRVAIEAWRVTAPGAPPRAMALFDRERPVEPVVFLRGDPARRGPRVPRRFLQLLAGPDAPPFQHGSGRRELAAAIADRNNPLTARVLVNRVWQHHFGRGLVDSADDFGLRTPEPLHAELLDYLAWHFMHDGWSLKRLHRLIVTSRTYCQASTFIRDTATAEESPATTAASTTRPSHPVTAQPTATAHTGGAAALDPENRLWWKAERRRLEFEALRDALLQVAGLLDRQMGGRPVDMFDPAQPPRRTLYGFVDRYNVPPLLRFFDVADPDTSTARRSRTVVPQQALFLMNSELVHRASASIVGQFVPGSVSGPFSGPPASPPATEETHGAIRDLFRRILSRDPSAMELELATAFLHGDAAPLPHAAASTPSAPAVSGPLLSPEKPVPSAKDRDQAPLSRERWRELAHVLLMSNEFFFVD